MKFHLYCENCSLQIGTFVYYSKLLSTQVVLDLYKFTIWCWVEYCSHFWFDFLKWDLNMLEKLQKEEWRVVSLTLSISLPVLQVLLWTGCDDYSFALCWQSSHYVDSLHDSLSLDSVLLLPVSIIVVWI